MLVLEFLPPETFLELGFRVGLYIGNKVERAHDLHAPNVSIEDLVDHDIDDRERSELTLAEARMDVGDQRPIDTGIGAPFFGLAATFGRVISPREHIFNAVLSGELVQRGEESDVLRAVLIGDL